MSVLVKGMEMPKDCRECRLMEYHSNLGETWCAPTVGLLAVNYKPIPFDGRPDWCPLVELPEKHGRLIDAEALIDTLEQAIAIMETMLKQLDLEADDGCLMEIKAYRDIRDGIKEIDAVIEAEGVEE